MKLNFNDILYAFSYGLDCVEHEMTGVTTNHGKRVAYMCILMGKHLNLQKTQLIDLAACAILHDNALTEYINSEFIRGINITQNKHLYKMGDHCTMGEKNMRSIPLCKESENAILYHHENADGSGPFGMKGSETPLFAQLIHLGDQIDVGFDLGLVSQKKYDEIAEFVENNRNIMFSDECADAFACAVEYEQFIQFKNEKIDSVLEESIEVSEREYSQRELIDFAEMFANIIDYKSKFTKHHSLGIAEKASQMMKVYGFDDEMATKMFLAGAVHDIGKLVVDKEILEKPDKLTPGEYRHIQNHAYYSYDILRKIKGFEEITVWAALHHEKLNGKGYPFGKTAEELGFNERLMACLDIYQALTEARPYKEGMSHQKSMGILNNMVSDGSLDGSIVQKIDVAFG